MTCTCCQGACCSNGNCTIVSGSGNCLGGTYRPGITSCLYGTCLGACCFPDFSCFLMANGSSCGGTFLGLGSTCSQCQQPPPCSGSAGEVGQGNKSGSFWGGFPSPGYWYIFNYNSAAAIDTFTVDHGGSFTVSGTGSRVFFKPSGRTFIMVSVVANNPQSDWAWSIQCD